MVMKAKEIKMHPSHWFTGRTSPQKSHWLAKAGSRLFAKMLPLLLMLWWLLRTKPNKDKLVWAMMGLSEKPQHQRL